MKLPSDLQCLGLDRPQESFIASGAGGTRPNTANTHKKSAWFEQKVPPLDLASLYGQMDM